MLSQIHIRDFAIIDTLELDLEPGMTLLTGETGAGKSILIDALALVLGRRAGADLIRPGARRAEVSARFELARLPHIKAWLETHELDEGDECILRRVITASGSKGYINGRPAPAQLLREVGERLVEIHGQHAHQGLLKSEVQRQALDQFGGHQALAEEVRELFEKWRRTRDELEELRRQARERDSRLELLAFHVEELEALAPREGEMAELEEEHRRLAHGDQILSQCGAALAALSEGEEHDLLTELNRQIAALERLREVEPAIAAACDLLSEAAIQIQEGATELRHLADRIELDPHRLAEVEARIGQFHELARKHHVDADRLPALLEELKRELDRLRHSDERLEALEREVEALARRHEEAATRLSRKRQQAARRLAKAVTGAIRQLGMPHGDFRITLAEREEKGPHPHGRERILFEVTTNPGQPPRPLGKVASGGELSRIALAIQLQLCGGQQIPTLIFDEVDTGIGGSVAETVGRHLRALGAHHQVLCVTHLPQVAALGHHHLHVAKQTDGSSTTTAITPLEGERRVEEIARMLGGMEITEQTRAHAREMVERGAALSGAPSPATA